MPWWVTYEEPHPDWSNGKTTLQDTEVMTGIKKKITTNNTTFFGRNKVILLRSRKCFRICSQVCCKTKAGLLKVPFPFKRLHRRLT